MGEPLTLTVTVSGEGNLRKVKIPPLAEVEGARVYEPRVNDAVANQGGKLIGERRWEYLILPQKEGQLRLPPVELAYFDPAEKRYLTKRTPETVVEVSGRATQSDTGGLEGLDTSVSERAAGGGDEMGPLHLIRRQASLSTGAEPVYFAWWFLVLLIGAPVGFIALVVVQRIRHRRIAMRDVVRSRRAAQVAVRALDAVENGHVDDGLSRIMKTVNEFFVDRLGRSSAGLTMDELRGFLLDRGASEEAAEKAVAIVERCEHVRFAGAGGHVDRELEKKLAADAKILIEELDGLTPRADEGGSR